MENIIRGIPNGGHLYRIREALGSGHAAVMIGSGFSLNAQNGSLLPMWDGLIESLLNDLFPSEADKLAARRRLGGTSGMLRLAEEYEAVLSRAQLDKRLHELLPDAGVVMPGDLHTKLLSLNWSDVYTTNYDTLLERALDTDRRAFNPQIKRRYQVVVAAEDVPFSKSNGRPRIVKLHGSLRTGSRLIVTEEDYRSYPTKFAPFVNTVQQSMLENVFCLVGFSGDDPNFLAWTGWVRDRLGLKTPPIYLITLKPVPEGQRLTLERRSVFPIDISQLGNSDGKSNANAALKALVSFWEDSPPPRRANWPYMRPTDTLRSVEPTVEQLVEWTACARRNRDDYPGWLVAPAGNRARLTLQSGIGPARLAYRRLKDSLPLWFRLVFLWEVMWILDESLNSVGKYFADEIAPELQAYVDGAGLVPASAFPDAMCSIKPTDAELRSIWAQLAVSMLRDARECGDASKFDGWMQTLQEWMSVRDMPEVRRLAIHEKILLKLEQRRRGEGFDLLTQLASVAGDGDLYWSVRIGALYGELGWTERGREFVRTGLRAIREAIQFEGESAYLLSREHWAERLLDALNLASETKPLPRRNASDATATPVPPEVTLRETVPREEDVPQTSREPEDIVHRDIDALDNIEHPNVQIEILRRELDTSDYLLQHNKLKFDANLVSAGPGLPHVRSEVGLAAIAFYRLVEKASFVPVLGNVGLTRQDLASCFRILSLVDGSDKNLRILCRANNESAVESLGLALVEQLSFERAEDLFHRSIFEIKRESDEGSSVLGWDHGTVVRVQLALDLASRLAFRLNVQHALSMLDVAIQLYDLQQVQEEYSLHEPLANFFERTLRLLPNRELAANSFRLLQLSPRNTALLHRSPWPSLVELLSSGGVKPDDGADWQGLIDSVLSQVEAISSTDDALSYYYARLGWMHDHGLMTQLQKEQFAGLLWRDGSSHSLPTVPGFYRGVVLKWPAISEQIAGDAFCNWIRNEVIEPIVGVSEVNGEKRPSIRSVRESFLTNVLISGNKGVRLIWKRAALLDVVNKVEIWWKDEGPFLLERARDEVRGEFAWNILTGRLTLIAHVLHRIVSPRIARSDHERQRISDWFAELWDSGLQLDFPLVPVVFAGLHWWPERSAEAIDTVIVALSSTTERRAVNAALNAAGHWLLSEEQQTEATHRYVNYLVDSVHGENAPLLYLRLLNIAELLRLGAERHFEAKCETLCSSLALLLQRLRSGTPTEDSAAFASKPLLRAAVVTTLVAMGERFTRVHDLASWRWAMQVAKSDNLLIVNKQS
ncbi:SIR2 family protein [Pandoraea sp. E26]|uniref:SIR2 family NAD-dependent protein deacylase n=1 Tax=Pandoraea sp. E26 TaxID=1427365 RepID=UPI0013778E0A|nr:SIR2 family protein [Pandoraea sp. E26]